MFCLTIIDKASVVFTVANSRPYMVVQKSPPPYRKVRLGSFPPPSIMERILIKVLQYREI